MNNIIYSDKMYRELLCNYVIFNNYYRRITLSDKQRCYIVYKYIR